MGKISRIEVKYIRADTTRKELTYTMDEKEKKKQSLIRKLFTEYGAEKK